jgi:hypothetical protein
MEQLSGTASNRNLGRETAYPYQSFLVRVYALVINVYLSTLNSDLWYQAKDEIVSQIFKDCPRSDSSLLIFRNRPILFILFEDMKQDC